MRTTSPQCRSTGFWKHAPTLSCPPTTSDWPHGSSLRSPFCSSSLPWCSSAPLGLGERGLVWANIINLTLRAAYAWRFITSWFAKRGRRALVSAQRAIPPISALATFALAAVVSRMSWEYVGDQDLKSQIKHVSVGVACLVVCAAECYRSQRLELHALYTFVRRR
jgi:hypothetical protein